MNGEWKSSPLGECARFLSGGTPSKKREDFWAGDIPWVSAKDLKIFRLHDAEDHVTAEAVKAGSRLAPENSIFLLVRGMTLHNDVPICVAKREMAFNQDIKALLPASGVDGAFLTYWLLANKPALLTSVDSAGHGTGRLNTDTLKAMEVMLPPLSEQNRIAHILGTLDDKIDLNRRMNATLEEMARALFQSWFVDFDPVRRNAESATPRPEDSLFPGSFEDSSIGEIPKDWKLIPLYETATYRNGAPFKASDFCPAGEGLPVVKIAELKNGLTDGTKWSPKELEPDQMIDTGDLLYSWSGSPDTSLDAFLWSNGPGLVNQHIFKVITSSDAEKRFVYYLLKHLRPVLVETARDKQTTGLGHVTVADMKRLQVCQPPPEVFDYFDRLIAPIFDKAFANTVESRTLATLRDTLLPKLLSGELSAHELQSLKEEALI